MAILRYPLEALTGTTDYLQIDIKEYVRQDVTGGKGSKLIGAQGFGRNTLDRKAGNTRSGSLSRKSVKNTGTILLQIPSDIKDGNSASYGDSKSGAEMIKTLTGQQTFAEGAENVRADLSANLKVDNPEALLDAAQKGLTAKATSAAMGVFGANVSTEQLMARQSG